MGCVCFGCAERPPRPCRRSSSLKEFGGFGGNTQGGLAWSTCCSLLIAHANQTRHKPDGPMTPVSPRRSGTSPSKDASTDDSSAFRVMRNKSAVMKLAAGTISPIIGKRGRSPSVAGEMFVMSPGRDASVVSPRRTSKGASEDDSGSEEILVLTDTHKFEDEQT